MSVRLLDDLARLPGTHIQVRTASGPVIRGALGDVYPDGIAVIQTDSALVFVPVSAIQSVTTAAARA